ncbi:Acetyl-CoA carboxylase, biotin carboxyl carrier protein [Limosilactobacillus gastricus PS3]|uniref:Biotin carboxyl carrier protein of acetyl-CoA carboxylase n=1 Tax=Limosilactobacillus gastricus PS3 TaxID=1144300 RepID=H4GIL2_9LACO|nr:acetyl-CoA carboxylase biotin carboxyl carrier protein [Limosilactobacillus gastricus]EHS87207.1 Acetyl-CoA carboxylase, biotin carboxyl carrier protein [Limosilactobacillus gastricus PS3]
MEFKDIQKLMTAFEKSTTREMDLADGDFHLYLSKNEQSIRSVEPSTTSPAVSAPSTKGAEETPAEPVKSAGQLIKSPLVGTVYLQPKPDTPAYVEVGSQVKVGDVVCIVEAMKMMTEIKSEVAGTISEINVQNGDLVEVEQPLFTVTEG